MDNSNSNTDGFLDFKKEFGGEMLHKVLVRLDSHNYLSERTRPPIDRVQQLYFSLLKMIDFECFRHGDAPEGLDEERVKSFLSNHGQEIHEKINSLGKTNG